MTGFPPRLIVVPSGDAPAGRAAEALARRWGAVLERVPARELSSRAECGGADLIVAGTRGRDGLDPALLAAGVPVLAVPEAAGPLNVTRILAPWNGRSYATRTLRYAGRLASSLRAELRVLLVAPDLLSVDETDSSERRGRHPRLGRRSCLSLRARGRREGAHREASSGATG
jgi:nucleotide-binding universal stress UspA family protein